MSSNRVKLTFCVKRDLYVGDGKHEPDLEPAGWADFWKGIEGLEMVVRSSWMRDRNRLASEGSRRSSAEMSAGMRRVDDARMEVEWG
jgi:hypothetical protein